MSRRQNLEKGAGGLACKVSLTAGKVGRPEREITKKLDGSLLELAIQALREGDFAEISLSTLAARIGVAKPTLYRRFGSKNGLLEALVEHEFSRMLEPSATLSANGRNPAEQLRDYARELFAYFVRPSTARFVRFLNLQDVHNPRLVEMRKDWHLRVVGHAASLISASGPSAKGHTPMALACLLIDLLDPPVGLYSLGFKCDEVLFGLSPDEFFESRYAIFRCTAGLG